MGVVKTILLVAFIIICILLILLVLVQNEDSDGMGGVFGGNSAAFGAHSGSVLSKTTGVFVALFFVIVFALALVTKAPSEKGGLNEAAESLESSAGLSTEEVEGAAAASSWADELIGNQNSESIQEDATSQAEE